MDLCRANRRLVMTAMLTSTPRSPRGASAKCQSGFGRDPSDDQACHLGLAAHEAFERDRPDLFLRHPHQFVVYHGQDQLGIYPTLAASLKDVQGRLPRGSYLLKRIEPPQCEVPLRRNDSCELPDLDQYPQLQIAQRAFLRDLPMLLREHPDKFVAYQCDMRVGIDESPWPLEELCGLLPLGTCEVFRIRPPDESSLDATPLF